MTDERQKQQLRDAFETLETVRATRFTTDELEECRADLFELDGYYAGIAQTVLNEGRIEYALHELAELRTRVERVKPSPEERAAYELALRHIDAIDRVRLALLPFAR